jgi:hypothetical protein
MLKVPQQLKLWLSSMTPLLSPCSLQQQEQQQQHSQQIWHAGAVAADLLLLLLIWQWQQPPGDFSPPWSRLAMFPLPLGQMKCLRC